MWRRRDTRKVRRDLRSAALRFGACPFSRASLGLSDYQIQNQYTLNKQRVYVIRYVVHKRIYTNSYIVPI